MSYDEFSKELESALLFQLTLNIKEGRISLEEGKKIASLYLQIQATNKQELLKALIEIEQIHPVISPLIAKYMNDADTIETARKLQKMHEEIKKGNIEKALYVGKGEI
ncbi:MAG: hypothetical protein KA035_00155 [Candidatus Levybacteria bacterium]|nr:hypothetical protein [Candidatus Levybacteria bacterium]